MPLYEYECLTCGTEFEFNMTWEDVHKGLEILCPKCYSNTVEKRMSVPSKPVIR